MDEIDWEQLKSAARIAQLDAFVTNDLTEDYHTEIGERGVRLSGGQRQRIGIARALYHNAELIVFDEATSALDNLTERDVIKATAALPGDKTLITIAHRLNTIKSCDKILILDRGRVVGFDHWDGLAQNNEIFNRIRNT